MPIRTLPPLLVNQIAAGEVIERPANVVKELVENSLDAGASQIRVRIRAGGRELIEVVDDGVGIDAAELALAVAPHSTSKIATVDDLGAIRTMGFRGEAIASIASVSHLRICSRTADAANGAEIEAEADRVGPIRPAATALGTTVSVQRLFFNTPARLKFLKTESTESGRVNEMLQSLALAHPEVGFTLESDGRVVLDLPGGQSRRERVIAIFGKELRDDLLELAESASESWIKVGGLTGTPTTARPTARHLRLYVNGRSVTDRSVLHAVRDAYRGLIDPTRYPTAAIFLEIDPREVDVNVHPTKAEVRFRNAQTVHGAVRHAVRSALRAADLVPELSLEERPAQPGRPTWLPLGPATSERGSTIPWSADVGPWSADVGARGSGGPGSAVPSWSRPRDSALAGFSITEARAAMAESLPPAPAEMGDAPAFAAPFRRVPYLQAHRKYLVIEDDEGITVVDQHALHERVMYEALQARLWAGDGQGTLESQQLLMPVSLPADRSRLEALESIEPLLRRLGIEAAASGPASIGVHAAPTLLFERGVEPIEFLGDLLDRVATGSLPAEQDAALSEVISMMACKAAIKAGDRLTDGEIVALLARRDAIERSTACPHGRPTSLRLTLRELDRQFGRG